MVDHEWWTNQIRVLRSRDLVSTNHSSPWVTPTGRGSRGSPWRGASRSCATPSAAARSPTASAAATSRAAAATTRPRRGPRPRRTRTWSSAATRRRRRTSSSGWTSTSATAASTTTQPQSGSNIRSLSTRAGIEPSQSWKFHNHGEVPARAFS